MPTLQEEYERIKQQEEKEILIAEKLRRKKIEFLEFKDEFGKILTEDELQAIEILFKDYDIELNLIKRIFDKEWKGDINYLVSNTLKEIIHKKYSNVDVDQIDNVFNMINISPESFEFISEHLIDILALEVENMDLKYLLFRYGVKPSLIKNIHSREKLEILIELINTEVLDKDDINLYFYPQWNTTDKNLIGKYTLFTKVGIIDKPEELELYNIRDLELRYLAIEKYGIDDYLVKNTNIEHLNKLIELLDEEELSVFEVNEYVDITDLEQIDNKDLFIKKIEYKKYNFSEDLLKVLNKSYLDELVKIINNSNVLKEKIFNNNGYIDDIVIYFLTFYSDKNSIKDFYTYIIEKVYISDLLHNLKNIQSYEDKFVLKENLENIIKNIEEIKERFPDFYNENIEKIYEQIYNNFIIALDSYLVKLINIYTDEIDISSTTDMINIKNIIYEIKHNFNYKEDINYNEVELYYIEEILKYCDSINDKVDNIKSFYFKAKKVKEKNDLFEIFDWEKIIYIIENQQYLENPNIINIHDNIHLSNDRLLWKTTNWEEVKVLKLPTMIDDLYLLYDNIYIGKSYKTNEIFIFDLENNYWTNIFPSFIQESEIGIYTNNFEDYKDLNFENFNSFSAIYIPNSDIIFDISKAIEPLNNAEFYNIIKIDNNTELYIIPYEKSITFSYRTYKVLIIINEEEVIMDDKFIIHYTTFEELENNPDSFSLETLYNEKI